MVASTVVAPIEEQINGVENMLYVSSNATADGRFTIAVTFDLGTNLDIAQVQVQNRVATATPRLPADVRNIGVTVNKSSPDLMMVVHLVFAGPLARHAVHLQFRDARDQGPAHPHQRRRLDHRVRQPRLLHADLARPAAAAIARTHRQRRDAGAGGQNVQVASGVLNQPPVDKPGAFQIAVKTQGRLADVEEFGNIVVKQTETAVVRLRDVAKIELAAVDYSSNSYLDLDPAVALAVFQRPGSNALSTAQEIRAAMEQLAPRFPPGVKYTIVYDPTQFIQESVNAVQETILEAILLVVLVIIIFLQTWRAAVIPLVAIPVSLIGTFFLMAMFGFTLNNLTLFGLVLAVGIVVDDAIVVVENVERNIAAGLHPREAAIKSMDEVGGALIAIALVLCAVFVPAAFITGISGQFYRQFALTIAGATVISLIVSLTLSPALAALLLKPHEHRSAAALGAAVARLLPRCSTAASTRWRHGYGWLAARVVRFAAIMLVLYAGILAFGLNEFRKTPMGFIPAVDRGFLIIVTQLPPGAALARTDAVNRRAVEIALKTPGHFERGEHRRLLRRDVHQCAQRRRDLRRARIRSRSAAAIPRCRRPGSPGNSTDGCPASRRR